LTIVKERSVSFIRIQRRNCAALTAVRHAFLIALAVLGAPLLAAAGTLAIGWDPPQEGEVLGYVVYVGTQPGVATQTFDVGNSTQYFYPNATPGVTYYFSVSAYGHNGEQSPRSLEIAGGLEAPPAAASLLSPSNTTTSATPTFTWAAVAGATEYLLQVDDAAEARKILRTYSAAEAGCAGGTAPCKATASVPLAAGAARWTIQASNSIGAGAWSSPAAFTVAATKVPRRKSR
jgi:hypothetical protein